MSNAEHQIVMSATCLDWYNRPRPNGKMQRYPRLKPDVETWIIELDEAYLEEYAPGRKQITIIFPNTPQDRFETILALFKLNW